MTLIRATKASKEKTNGNFVVFDYPMSSEDIGVALQKLHGRIPTKGRYRNKICKEICFVIEGSATVYLDDKSFKVTKGDVFIIDRKKKSHVVANKMKALVITKPNWYKDQCEIINE